MADHMGLGLPLMDDGLTLQICRTSLFAGCSSPRISLGRISRHHGLVPVTAEVRVRRQPSGDRRETKLLKRIGLPAETAILNFRQRESQPGEIINWVSI